MEVKEGVAMEVAAKEEVVTAEGGAVEVAGEVVAVRMEDEKGAVEAEWVHQMV